MSNSYCTELPDGSWNQTARNVFTKNGVLYAELRKIDGTWKSDMIHLYPNAILTNGNGQFISENCHQCTHPDLVNCNLPNGSWIITAKDYFVKNGILCAKLMKKNGTLATDAITVGPDTVLTNINGKFVQVGCTSCADRSVPVPRGDWKQSARNIKITNGILCCELKTNQGTWTTDVIRLEPNLILTNNDGKLCAVGDDIIVSED